ncbi:hypothetical protein JXB31_04960 [Candidatus Woesearchaeota archaeon]|nr:hypothetical protein [Candidatus Woesearchaeota archaeon]
MERIDWMLGMTDNMMSMTQANMEKPMVKEIYGLVSSMMGNLNLMKMGNMMEMSALNMMEGMMRNMEEMMKGMDMDNHNQKMIMKSMMSYMVMMQMHMITSMKMM